MIGIVLAVAFLAGVLLHDSGAGWMQAIPFVGGALVALIMTGRWSDRALVLLALVMLVLGAWRASNDTSPSAPLDVPVGEGRAIDAVVVGIPRRESTRVEVDIRVDNGNGARIAVSLPPYPVVNGGDSIRFRAPESWVQAEPGFVELPQSPASNDVFVPAFEVTRSNTSLLAQLRNRTNAQLTSSIERFVPEPAAALTLGVLNGDDSGMTAAMRQRFRMSGMSHITAVSGWNVALVAGFISLLTRRLAPTSLFTLLAGASFVWTYAFIVGMGPSVLRAAGMATVFLAARWRGRQGDLMTSMLVTVALIVALTPSIRFDFGFQLSVAATLGIVLFVEQSLLLPEWQSALLLPFVAQIATAPLQLHHFGTFSPLAPIANLVSAPLVGLVMAGGIATVVASLIHPGLAEIAGIVTWLPARLITAIAEHEPSSGAANTMSALSWSATFVAYTLFIVGWCLWSLRLKRNRIRLRALQADASI